MAFFKNYLKGQRNSGKFIDIYNNIIIFINWGYGLWRLWYKYNKA